MYGIIAVVPEREFQAARPGMDQIVQSFHAAGSGAGGGAGSEGQGPGPASHPGYAQQPPQQMPPGPATQDGGDPYGRGQQDRRMPPAGAPFVGLALAPDQNGEGALIGAVAPGGPAETAGMRAGDLIVAINGRRISDPGAVPAAVGRCRPGDTLQSTVSREGRQGNVRVVVGASPGAGR